MYAQLKNYVGRGNADQFFFVNKHHYFEIPNFACKNLCNIVYIELRPNRQKILRKHCWKAETKKIMTADRKVSPGIGLMWDMSNHLHNQNDHISHASHHTLWRSACERESVSVCDCVFVLEVLECLRVCMCVWVHKYYIWDTF